MDLGLIIKYGYKLFIYSPYIFTFFYLFSTIYNFFRNNDTWPQNGITALVGIVSIVSLLLCMKVFLPNLLITEVGTFGAFINQIGYHIVEIFAVSIAIISISRSEEIFFERNLTIPFASSIGVGSFWIMTSVFEFILK